eukprot:2353622-Pleurochrysis_carterae.AAC.1
MVAQVGFNSRQKVSMAVWLSVPKRLQENKVTPGSFRRRKLMRSGLGDVWSLLSCKAVVYSSRCRSGLFSKPLRSLSQIGAFYTRMCLIGWPCPLLFDRVHELFVSEALPYDLRHRYASSSKMTTDTMTASAACRRSTSPRRFGRWSSHQEIMRRDA